MRFSAAGADASPRGGGHTSGLCRPGSQTGSRCGSDQRAESIRKRTGGDALKAASVVALTPKLPVKEVGHQSHLSDGGASPLSSISTNAGSPNSTSRSSKSSRGGSTAALLSAIRASRRGSDVSEDSDNLHPPPAYKADADDPSSQPLWALGASALGSDLLQRRQSWCAWRNLSIEAASPRRHTAFAKLELTSNTDGAEDFRSTQLSSRACSSTTARSNSESNTRDQKQIRRLGENEKIFDLYFWDKVLQEEGNGGKVVVCYPKILQSRSGDAAALPDKTKSYVLKMRSKQSLRESRMEEQFQKTMVKLLNMPPHPGVLKVYEELEDDKFFYIVMERASGGPFFEGLLREYSDGVMPEKAVRTRMQEIIEAVAHVHGQGMLHRDIKPDNLVLTENHRAPRCQNLVRRVALIDFDHADPEFDTRTEKLESNAIYGTVRFSAPETFAGRFSRSSDLYSVGVILYLLMTGELPYKEDVYAPYDSACNMDNDADRSPRSPRPTRSCDLDQDLQSPRRLKLETSSHWKDRVHQRMRDSRIDWSCDPWPNQPTCQAFCQWLLAFNPSERPQSAGVALAHEWFSS